MVQKREYMSYNPSKTVKDIKIGHYMLKKIKRTKGLRKVFSGGYGFVYEGNAYWKDTMRFAGSFRVKAENIEDFKGKIKLYENLDKRRKY